jgi:hypothetical protein
LYLPQKPVISTDQRERRNPCICDVPKETIARSKNTPVGCIPAWEGYGDYALMHIHLHRPAIKPDGWGAGPDIENATCHSIPPGDIPIYGMMAPFHA